MCNLLRRQVLAPEFYVSRGVRIVKTDRPPATRGDNLAALALPGSLFPVLETACAMAGGSVPHAS